MSLKILFFPLAFISALVFFFWQDKPAYDKWRASKDQLAQLQQEAEGLNSGIKNIETALGQYKNLSQEDKQLIINAFPFDRNNDDFIAELKNKVDASSGVFLSRIDLKTKKGNSSCSGSEGLNSGDEVSANNTASVITSSGEEGEATGGALVVCSPQKSSNTANLELSGQYSDLKKVIQEIDLQNRLTIAKDLKISEASDKNSSSAGAASLNSEKSLKLNLSFDFFHKEKNDKTKLSLLTPGADKVFDDLFAGKFGLPIIQKFKSAITQVGFNPVVINNFGKENIFEIQEQQSNSVGSQLNSSSNSLP